MSSTGFAVWKSDELGFAAHTRPDIVVFNCSFPQPVLVWQLPGGKVPYGNCHMPGPMSRHCISSPNIIDAGATASLSVWKSNDSRNPQFRCTVLLIFFMAVISCVLPSQLCQFIKLHLLLPKPLHALLHRFGDCAHYPAGFVIFAQLAQLCLFIILIFPILPIVRICKITQTVSNCDQHLLRYLFGLSVR